MNTAGDERTASEQDQEGSPEDRKAAVTMWVTLSTQVMAATLALIAVEGAFTTFVLEKRLPPFWFYVFVVFTVLAFVFSILSGGAGINRLTRNGYKGIWNLDHGQKYFRQQSSACLVGLALLFLSLFSSGPTKEEVLQKEAATLKEQVQLQQSRLDNSTDEIKRLREDVDSAKNDVQELRTALDKVTERLNQNRCKSRLPDKTSH